MPLWQRAEAHPPLSIQVVVMVRLGVVVTNSNRLLNATMVPDHGAKRLLLLASKRVAGPGGAATEAGEGQQLLDRGARGRAVGLVQAGAGAVARPAADGRRRRQHGALLLEDGEHLLECGQRGADHGDVDFDHRPQVDRDGLLDWVCRERVLVDGVQADDGRDAAEDADAEDDDQRDLFTRRPLDAPEGGGREP